MPRKQRASRRSPLQSAEGPVLRAPFAPAHLPSTSIVVDILSKLLSAISIAASTEVINGFIEVLNNGLGKAFWGQFAQAVNNRAWGRVRGMLKQLLEALTDKRFANALAKRIRSKTAKELVKKVASKFIPLIGWAILIGAIVYVFGKQLEEK